MPSIIRATTSSGLQVAPDNSGSLQLQTNGTTTAVTIDTSQNVGIGTTSPGAKLDVVGSSGVYTRLGTSTSSFYTVQNGTTDTFLYNQEASTLRFGTNATEQMRIDSSGIITGTAGNLMLISSTSQATTSGTSKDFTGIPSWVKRITVIFRGVSTNGTSATQIQIGSGSVTTSGYVNGYSIVYGTNLTAITTSTSGFTNYLNGTGDLATGIITISLIAANTYVASGTLVDTATGRTSSQGGSIALSGALDRVRITTGNGTDIFDAGSVNIFYE